MAVQVLFQGEFLKRLFNLKQGIAKIAPGIATKAANVLQDEVIDQIRQAGAVASGDLLKSITSSVLFSSTEFLVEIGSNNIAAQFIERGRRPGGFPPIQRIYKWMVDKGLDATLHGAYSIASKIEREGYSARMPFEKAIEAALPKIEKSMGKIIESELSIT